MANAKGSTLYRLRDSDLTLTDPDQDVRGRKVFDAGGDEVGEVNDLLVDPGERKVRFLRVGSGGFLGIGETEFLIPVDAVTRVTADAVHVDQTRDQVAGAPRYNPDLIEERYLDDLSKHYGYRSYREPGYTYPPYPYYPI
jgi:sporulation protein YlmC with PRC-barrel domain